MLVLVSLVLPTMPVVSLFTLLAEQGRQAQAGKLGELSRGRGSCRHVYSPNWGCSRSSGHAAFLPLGADPVDTDGTQLQGLFSGAYIRLQTEVAMAEGVHGDAHAQHCE